MAYHDLFSYVGLNKVVATESLNRVRALRKGKEYDSAHKILENYESFGISHASAQLELVNLLSEEGRFTDCEDVLKKLCDVGGKYREIALFRLVRLYSKLKSDKKYESLMNSEFLHDVYPSLQDYTGVKNIKSSLTTPLAGGHVIASRSHLCGTEKIFEKVRRKGSSTDQEVYINQSLSQANSASHSVSPKFWGQFQSENYISMFFDDIDPEKCDFQKNRIRICDLITQYHRRSYGESFGNKPELNDVVLDATSKPSIRTISNLVNQIGSENTEGVGILKQLGLKHAKSQDLVEAEDVFDSLLTEKTISILCSNPTVLQHGDLNKTNILYSKRYSEPKLIDWEIAGPGMFGYDFGYFFSHQGLDFKELLELSEFIAKRYDDDYPNVIFSVLYFYLLCVSFLHPGWVRGKGNSTFVRTKNLIEDWIS